ncbi:MAG: alanine--tRNA ligase [Verrucomicrobiaceae bacterium]|nr:alanine--tRNA ligase [Verrucomicrobiaceae bacterium]
MTSAELRQSFMDFFKSKSHTIVPSASLMPSSPNLLFTNAGMNQFVPYFLGEEKNPFLRAADTQKCIRAGGKHNDLEDVGFDTYHHTFFEMLGNWSFGDYFKKEAIQWAWELLTEVWKFPKERLYATVYEPAEGEPSEFDAEAYAYWVEIFNNCGLDPEVHIKKCGKKDNFWMMGETGPCGPCSEIHIDLTPNGDTKGELVNAGSPLCIEIWNLVFMQFNAEVDGSFVPLKNKNIDTGMGLERVAGIFATTKNFTDFSQLASNYNSDLFTDIFKHISHMSGKFYKGTLPTDPREMNEQELIDCVFRVLADHIRTLTFSIADGIIPGNDGRNYVLRRILRRAIMYGKRLGLERGFFTKLAEPVIAKMSPIFPELIEQKKMILKTIENEENSFAKTIDRGLQLLDNITLTSGKISGEQAFILYDTYGFPLDLTQLIARERHMPVDVEGFEAAMERQRRLSREAQKREIISVSDASEVENATQFIGYEAEHLTDFQTKITAIVEGEDCDYLIFPQTPFYAEKGGQVGDTGFVEVNGHAHEITDTQADKAGHVLHKIRKGAIAKNMVGKEVSVSVDGYRRRAIQRHHSATHILHWALRQVLGNHVKQKGSYVDPERLRFDFHHFEAPTREQLKEVELLANKKILENSKITWRELPFREVPKSCMALFEEKYGAIVRIVEMGNFSQELCGGTHANATGDLGFIKILSEGAISAGTRRIEAAAGTAALECVEEMQKALAGVSQQLSCKQAEVNSRLEKLIASKNELEKEIRNYRKADATKQAKDVANSAVEKNGVAYMVAIVDAESPADLRDLSVKIMKEKSGVVVLGASFGEKATVLASCSPEAIEASVKAGDIVRQIAGELGGKGGGKPDFAQGGGASANLKSVFNNFIASLK